MSKVGIHLGIEAESHPEHSNRNYYYILFFRSVVSETTDIRTVDTEDLKHCFICNTLLFNVKDLLMNAHLRRHWPQ